MDFCFCYFFCTNCSNFPQNSCIEHRIAHSMLCKSTMYSFRWNCDNDMLSEVRVWIFVISCDKITYNLKINLCKVFIYLFILFINWSEVYFPNNYQEIARNTPRWIPSTDMATRGPSVILGTAATWQIQIRRTDFHFAHVVDGVSKSGRVGNLGTAAVW